jgi:hypothetical protein
MDAIAMGEMRRILIVVLVLVTSGYGSGWATSGQNKQDPFAAVPPSQRDQLRSRLLEFVAYHRAKDWEKVYDLLAQKGKDRVEGGLSRNRFLKERLNSRFSRFTPKATQYNIQGDAAITIWGCASFDRGGNLEAALDAYLQNGDWYFTEIWSVAPCVDCAPRQCKH